MENQPPPTSQSRVLQDPQQPDRQVEVIYALPPHYAPASQDQEPTLIDVLLLAWGHRWQIILPPLILGAVATIYALSLVPPLTFQTTLVVGLSGQSEVQQEQPADILQRIEGVFLPQLVAQPDYHATFSIDEVRTWATTVSVSNPRNTRSIIIQSSGLPDEKALHVAMLAQLAEMTAADNLEMLNPIRRQLNERIVVANRELQTIEQRRQAIVQRHEGLAAEQETLKGELETLGNRIDRLQKIWEARLLDNTDNNLSPPNSMLESTLQADRSLQSSLQRRLLVDIPADRASLDREWAGLALQEQNPNNRLELLHQDLAHLRPTRTVSPPVQSLQSNGRRRSLIVAGGIFFGGFIGLAWALIAHIVLSHRAKLSACQSASRES